MRTRRTLQGVHQVDGDWILSRDERRENRRERHHQHDADSDARAIIAEESLSLLGIEHHPPSLLRALSRRALSRWIPELRRCVRRLTLPSAVLPEILRGHYSHPMFQALRETRYNCIHIAISLTRLLRFDSLDPHSKAAVRLPERNDEQYGHLESQGEY